MARSFPAICSADAWSCTGPTCTRYSRRPVAALDTPTGKPPLRTCCARRSAFAALAKLPSCTTQAPLLLVEGFADGVASGSVAAAACGAACWVGATVGAGDCAGAVPGAAGGGVLAGGSTAATGVGP